jgi:hypothetical protein
VTRSSASQGSTHEAGCEASEASARDVVDPAQFCGANYARFFGSSDCQRCRAHLRFWPRGAPFPKEWGFRRSGSVLANKSQNYGFDAQTEQYGDMLSAGIVDSAKLTRVALQNAAWVAGLMTTTAIVLASNFRRDRPAWCRESAMLTGGRVTASGPLSVGGKKGWRCSDRPA